MGALRDSIRINAFRSLTCLVFLILPLLTLMSAATANAAGIVGSKHDLTTKGYPYGLCSECHTPHGAQDIRLWPRTSRGTAPGAIVSPATLAVSKVCLDCHQYDSMTELPTLPNASGVKAWGAVGWNPVQLYDNTGNLTLTTHSGSTDKNCTDCHPHNKGFSPIPCDSCHGFPPGYDSDLAIPCDSGVIPGTGKVGAADDPLNPTGADCDINVPEAGKHAFHTREYADGRINDTQNTGYPKMQNNCLGRGCHATDAHRTDPGDLTEPDYVGEVVFDIYNNSTAQVEIDKDSILGYMNTLGDSIPDLNMGVPGSFDYTTKTCSNVYCHSNVQASPPTGTTGMTYATPIWNTDPTNKAPCGSCHDDNTNVAVSGQHTGVLMGSGSHSRHVDGTTYGFDCQDCHFERGKKDPGLGDTTKDGYHVNGFIDLNINKAVANINVGTSNGTPGVITGSYNSGLNRKNPGDIYYSCADVYCHSNGMDAKGDLPLGIPSLEQDPATNMYFATPTWGSATPTNCESCHGSVNADLVGTKAYGAPDYVSGGGGAMHANSHLAHVTSQILHVAGGELTCSTCHLSTIADTNTADGLTLVSPSTTHVNGDVDLSSSKYAFKFNVNAQKRCYNSCHGVFDETIPAEAALAPQWGGTVAAGGCFTCHGATATLLEDVVRPSEPIGEPVASPPNKISATEYEARGHGLDSTVGYLDYLGNLGDSGNPGAGFRDYSSARTQPGCFSTSDTEALNGCHFNIEKAVDNPYLLGPYATDVDSLCQFCHVGGGVLVAYIGKSHTQTETRSSKTWGITPKCVDCHDPHGDSNNYMIKYGISRIYGSTLYGSPMLSDGSANAGIAKQPALMKPVTFNLTAVGYNGNPGQAGDYYNYDADGLSDGICQVCHSQNLVYSYLDQAGEVKAHSNNMNASDTVTDFLPEDGRRCTECHHHDDAATEITGFGRPYIDEPVPSELYCTDCHVWDPNGDLNHPLMSLKANGGLLEGLADSSDENDDIDNYTFGYQALKPSMPDFTDRAMIDGTQWVTDGHGAAASSSLPPTNKFGAKSGPELLCTDCHDRDVPHGTGTNPFRLYGITANPASYDPAVPDGICLNASSPCHGSAATYDLVDRHDFGTAYTGGKCFDCHDPHGDTARPNTAATQALTGIVDANINSAMIQREVVTVDRWLVGLYGNPRTKLEPSARYYATGNQTDYVKNNLNYSGICEVCHVAATTMYFRRKNADGDTLEFFHNEPTSPCTSCHTHPQKFEPPTYCDCITCHEQLANQFDIGQAPTPGRSKHDVTYDATYVATGATTREKCPNQDCLKCHDLDDESLVNPGNPNHMDGFAHLKVGTSAVYRSESGYRNYQGTTWSYRNDLVYGDLKADDPTGAFCALCHNGQVLPVTKFTGSGTPPDVYRNFIFTSRGHGASDNATGNFPRTLPNSVSGADIGKGSCTACHNYHGVINKSLIHIEKAGVALSYPIADNGDNAQVDTKEVFCLEACHADVRASYGDKQDHYVFNYTGNPTTYDQDPGDPPAHYGAGDGAYYLVSKAVGFVLGGTDPSLSKYVHDPAEGEQQVYVEDVALINAKLKLNANDRAICVTCHDPHGSDVDSTWGLPSKSPASTDDQMLRHETSAGSAWTTIEEPCDVCHLPL